MGDLQLRWGTQGTATVRLSPEPLGRGGEGAVFAATASEDPPGLDGAPLVIKRYHDAQLDSSGLERAAKVDAMVAARPDSDALCWPLAAAFDAGRPVGFAMRGLDAAHQVTWAQLANPADRAKNASGFSFRYALRAVANLAVAIDAAHRTGAVLGDVNESNIFVSDTGTVTIIDCDSAQVRAADGTLFRCLVGKPDYTAPELVGHRFADVDRQPASDVFAYAVLAFQMLAGGSHPYDGIPADLDRDLPPLSERIARGLCPYLGRGGGVVLPAPRVPVAALPSALAGLFAATLLADDPALRPPLSAWFSTISTVEANLVDCTANAAHSYDRRDGSCGWCQHQTVTGRDPWQASGPMAQAALPPVGFHAHHVPATSFTPAPTPPPAPGPSPSPVTAYPGAPVQGTSPHVPHPVYLYPQPPAPPEPAETYTSAVDFMMRHPVRAWRYGLSKLPLRDQVGSRWIMPRITAVPPASPTQSALRWVCAVAGWAATVWLCTRVAVPAALVAAGVDGAALDTATRVLNAAVLTGVAVSTAAFSTGVARQARWRLWRGWQWGDTVRFAAMAPLGAFAVPVAAIGAVLGLVAAALRAAGRRS